MILRISAEELMGFVGECRERWCDLVVPQHVEPHPHNRYSPRYSWMFAYEKELRDRLAATGQSAPDAFEPLLFGSDGALSEGLSNAFVHGHRRDPSLPIEITTIIGVHGFGFTVVDQGKGFDVVETLGKATRGQSYFRHAGNGMKTLLTSTDVLAAFDRGGTRLGLFLRHSPGRG